LEPCCTHGRTPPCTDAVIAAGISKVVVGTTDPNPAHAGKAFGLLRRAGIEVIELAKDSEFRELAEECSALNEAFNHWIVHRTTFVTVKAAMTLDGKIATARGESKWITGEKARAYTMKLRQSSDAILVGVNTVLADDPTLMPRIKNAPLHVENAKRRIVLDPQARTPLNAKVVADEFAELTIIVVSQNAPKDRIAALAKKVSVLIAPNQKAKIETQKSQINLRWLLKKLGSENVTSLLVEGGGETNAAFLLGGFAHRVAFFYAPKVLGGRDARKSVGGDGITGLSEAIKVCDAYWQWLGEDLLLTGRIG
ncbi:MAG TPA: bifunctional diaminohydroxyphosphoribosylaminopyrimidine deaminase/5-amino-6-(5-phosphoribosylamino)uracil reductase RibD, partial [Verrucomicrobiae bacterium]|nr:bifunctional diaminohydroxyphosphoribosylaminopyrimidine deaminase/5-amino-6-(5-phosphoribosylamino)uracil reductase RibD [Verrucomicrobiae bacterium]